MFKINNSTIGGTKTFIIAEIGINHQGNFNKCKKLIYQAKKSGADAVKLQICDPEYSYSKNTISYKVFKKNLLNFDQIKKIKKYSDKLKIILFATPGDFQSLKIVQQLNFPAVKISSGLITNEAMVSEICKLKKPIIFSTGMAFIKEIKKVSKIIKKFKNNFGILKCTSLYPSPAKNINLRSIQSLKKKFPKTSIGYSDHTRGIDACIASVAAGAQIIEKHLTLNEKLNVPDQAVSCNPFEFNNMVKKIRYIENIMGEENVFPSSQEKIKRKFYHRFIISVKKINKGESFNINNIALKRSNNIRNGLHPKYFFKILGKKAKKNIKADICIKKKDF